MAFPIQDPQVSRRANAALGLRPGPNQYLSRPESYSDTVAANRLGNVLAGADERFGTGAGGSEGLPFSMFNRRTVKTDPGRYTVHPMIPSYGGPMPGPAAAPMGTTAADRAAGERGWLQRHQASDGSAYAATRADGSNFVQGNQAADGRPGWSYMPAGQAAGIYNRFVASKPGLGLSPLQFGPDGSVSDADGNPVDDQAMARMMMGARQAGFANKRDAMRQSQRLRSAFAAVRQRGDYSKLGGLASAGLIDMFGNRGQQGGMAQAGEIPQNGQALFGMAQQMISDPNSGLTVGQRMKFAGKLAQAMSLPNGHTLIADIIAELGGNVEQRQRFNDANQPRPVEDPGFFGRIADAVIGARPTNPVNNPFDPRFRLLPPPIVGNAPRRPAPNGEPQFPLPPGGGMTRPTPLPPKPGDTSPDRPWWRRMLGVG